MIDGETSTPRLEKTARRAATPYERVKQEVLRGELLPGEVLVEATLAERLDVSRTPVREALLRLEQDGLVSRTDRGVVVRERSPEEILDIYSIRILLESAAARTAAERRSDLDILSLRRAEGMIESLETEDPGARADANRRFHQAVWRATHHEPLTDLLQRIDLHLARYPMTTLTYPGRWEASMPEHRAIVDAIEARDGDAAADLATIHFTAAREIRLRLWTEGDL